MPRMQTTKLRPENLDPDITHVVFALFELGTRMIGQYKTRDAAARQAAFNALQGRDAVLLNVRTGEAEEFQAVNLTDHAVELGWLEPGTIVSVEGIPAKLIASGDGWAFLVGEIEIGEIEK